MAFTVTVLGNNAAVPAQGRHPTALVVNLNEQFYLLDCGEGTQMRLLDLKIKPGRLHTIFISHLHGDHYFGLVGLLTSFHLNRRELPLTIICPKGLQEIIQLQFKYSDTHLCYPLHIIEVDAESNKKVFENNAVEVFTIPMIHRIPTCGYLFREKEGQRRINVEATTKYEVSFQHFNNLKAGKDYINTKGETIKNESLTFNPHPIRTFAFCSDTLYTETYLDIIKNADTIYHESTFLEEDGERATERFHCTAIQAATIAKKAHVKKLLLGHFSAKYPGTDLFGIEARTVFENSVATVEGESYNVGE
jgi:ribonuclease Z